MPDEPTILDRFEGLISDTDKPPEAPPEEDILDEEPVEEEQVEEEPVAEEEEQVEDEEVDPDDLSSALWTIPGEEKELTTEEVIAGHMRQADYTRKTQKLAEERKSASTAAELAREKTAKYDDSLGRLETAIESLLPKEEDLSDLRKSNPAEYAARMAEIQNGKTKLAAVQAERQRLSDERAQELQASFEQEVMKEQELVLERIPEWKDATVRDAEVKDMVATAKSLGYTEEDLGMVSDHRLIMLLRMAMKQNKQEGLKPIVRKRTKGARVVSQPGAKKRQPSKKGKSQEARARLRETGNINDAAEAFFHDLGVNG